MSKRAGSGSPYRSLSACRAIIVQPANRASTVVNTILNMHAPSSARETGFLPATRSARQSTRRQKFPSYWDPEYIASEKSWRLEQKSWQNLGACRRTRRLRARRRGGMNEWCLCQPVRTNMAARRRLIRGADLSAKRSRFADRQPSRRYSYFFYFTRSAAHNRVKSSRTRPDPNVTSISVGFKRYDKPPETQ